MSESPFSTREGPANPFDRLFRALDNVGAPRNGAQRPSALPPQVFLRFFQATAEAILDPGELGMATREAARKIVAGLRELHAVLTSHQRL